MEELPKGSNFNDLSIRDLSILRSNAFVEGDLNTILAIQQEVEQRVQLNQDDYDSVTLTESCKRDLDLILTGANFEIVGGGRS